LQHCLRVSSAAVVVERRQASSPIIDEAAAAAAAAHDYVHLACSTGDALCYYLRHLRGFGTKTVLIIDAAANAM
jgi:hypothetical protein